MQIILHKLILLGCSVGLAAYAEINMHLIVLLLCSICFAALGYFFEHRVLRSCIFFAFCIAGQFYLPILFFLPAVFYDICYYPVFPISLAGIISILIQSQAAPWHMAIVMLLAFIAFLLCDKEIKYVKLQASFRNLQDTEKEMQLRLNHQNKVLLEKYNTDMHLATMSERSRIAGEIHDNVGHLLTSSILQIGALLACNPPQTEALNTLQGTLSSGMDSIRSSIHDLHDRASNLYDETMAITSTFVKCDCHLEYDIDIAPVRQIHNCFLFTLKEALSNINKHSNATAVQITLREHPAFYQLIIADNGNVKKHALTNPHGIGIQTMKERVDALRGNIHVSTDSGFQIFISVSKELAL